MNKYKRLFATLLMAIIVITSIQTSSVYASTSLYTSLGEGTLLPTATTTISIEASKGDFDKVENISLINESTKKIVLADIKYMLKNGKFEISIYPRNNFEQNKNYTLKIFTAKNAYTYALSISEYVDFSKFEIQTRDVVVGYSNTSTSKGPLREKYSFRRIEVPANPAKGFYFPYFLEVPVSFTGDYSKYLMVIPNNTGYVNSAKFAEDVLERDDYGNRIGLNVVGSLRMPLLVPAFPRENGMMDTHLLDTETIKLTKVESDKLGLGNLVDIEKQLVAMFNDAKAQFKANGIVLNDKMVMDGFSSSGKFVNRFSMIYPELVEIVISGTGQTAPMLPYDKINNKALNYPLGIADFKILFGKDFNLDAYQKVKQFWYVGENDRNEILDYPDSFTAQEASLMKSYLGNEMTQRWASTEKYMNDKKISIQLHTYKNIGHSTSELIDVDLVNFIKSNLGKPTLNKITPSVNGN